MDIKAEKLFLIEELAKSNDLNLIAEIKSILLNQKNNIDLSGYYKIFRGALKEIKADKNGELALKDAKDWLNEL